MNSGYSFKSTPGRLLKIYVKYLYGSRLFAFAVSTILYTVALAFAPLGLPLNNQFFLPTVNGRIALSAKLLDISIFPSSKYLMS